MTELTLHALSPLDGRYTSKAAVLAPYFSEFALMRYRLRVEVEWLIALSTHPDIHSLPPIEDKGIRTLHHWVQHFDDTAAKAIKRYESQTNHDVKAVEYYLRDCLSSVDNLAPYIPFIHFGCTSEDINNVAYALMLKDALDAVITPTLHTLLASITALGHEHANIAMLARTHGQPATPTTLGKEVINIAARLKDTLKPLLTPSIKAKFNGAVGNYNAHTVAFPDLDWVEFSASFLHDLGLTANRYTTQIEPHDGLAELSHAMVRLNTILTDFARDVWQYISLGYFKQKTVSHEVGSSTMPHKVNPIDFENAEGNLGLSNALFNFFATKLPISRLQRDLSDSTVLRNLGVAFGHSLIAYESLKRGLNKLAVDEHRIQHDLAQHWDVLAEPLQTVMRQHGIPDAYEKIRDMTRGKGITKAALHEFIKTLDLPAGTKKQLLHLTPAHYTGLAARLALDFKHD